jgi:hypothetical protein
LNNAISTAGASTESIWSDTGAIIGGLIGSGVADRVNASYPPHTLQPERIGSRARTRPISTNPDSNKTLATRLYHATFDGSSVEPITPAGQII